MGITNGLKGFGLGMLADYAAGGVSRGMFSMLLGLGGLFLPDAKSTKAVADQADVAQAPRRYGGLKMFESIFGPDAPAWKKVGAATVGLTALTGILGNFGLPLAFAGLIPFNGGAMLPLAWNSGLIPPGCWGWLAGTLY